MSMQAPKQELHGRILVNIGGGQLSQTDLDASKKRHSSTCTIGLVGWVWVFLTGHLLASAV